MAMRGVSVIAGIFLVMCILIWARVLRRERLLFDQENRRKRFLRGFAREREARGDGPIEFAEIVALGLESGRTLGRRRDSSVHPQHKDGDRGLYDYDDFVDDRFSVQLVEGHALEANSNSVDHGSDREGQFRQRLISGGAVTTLSPLHGFVSPQAVSEVETPPLSPLQASMPGGAVNGAPEEPEPHWPPPAFRDNEYAVEGFAAVGPTASDGAGAGGAGGGRRAWVAADAAVLRQMRAALALVLRNRGVLAHERRLVDSDKTLRRFLVARGGPDAAARALANTLLWRESRGIRCCGDDADNDVNTGDSSLSEGCVADHNRFCFFPVGLDNEGNVLIYTCVARAEDPSAVNVEATFDHAVAVMEECLSPPEDYDFHVDGPCPAFAKAQSLGARARTTGPERVLLLVDFTGYGVKHMSRSHAAYGEPASRIA